MSDKPKSLVERTCALQSCSKVFFARTADVKAGWGLYCCKPCKAKAQAEKKAAEKKDKQ
ncbi:hypothetical protein FDI24_gp013 [Acidovorax phage ACP17]|uniref:Uncharacterized protein n=1 Tax=Acidovorax phage ACP17 TaxID=2010329 RepID=A0A218M3D1_9CAUD|nr:hypothetical protein FDI24_gp013 [Acidovorax phage ACP17]ASD50547.1 hypothetical protein [Acidovorax phage ACP17]